MAAKAEKFNLMDLLNQRSKQKQETEEQYQAAGREEGAGENKQQENNVFMVDAYDMIPSKENFYHVDTALKRSIELVGILQPCIVKKPVNGKYDVIAGHRRRLASLALVEEGKEQFRYIPCMYKKEDTADKLAIIMANSFRDKTDFEKMIEIVQLKDLVKDLKREYSLPGRVREMQQELTGITESQISRYEAIYNNLEKELMEEFKTGKLIFTVAVEVSGMEREWQLKAYNKLLGNGELSLAEAKQMKKQIEAEKQCPGQMELPDMQQEETEQEEGSKTETITSICYSCDKGDTCHEKRATTTKCNAYVNYEEQEVTEEEYRQQIEEEPEPETVTSICYHCDKYEKCNERKDTVTKCTAYINRKEARLTEEEKYNREQAAIDRETKKKLREKAQEEKMQNLPGDERKKVYVRISKTQYSEIEEGKKPYIILKTAERFKVGDLITAQIFEGGRSTGEVTELYVNCLDDENTSSAINSGYIIAGILKKEVAEDLGLLEDVER